MLGTEKSNCIAHLETEAKFSNAWLSENVPIDFGNSLKRI